MGSSFGEGSLEVAATICWRRGLLEFAQNDLEQNRFKGDKRAFFEQTLSCIYLMAGPNQSKKETVELPLPPPERPPDLEIKPRKTARIQAPVRESMDKTPLPIPIPTPIPAPVAQAPDSSGLNKETARVSDMPDSPAAEMKETEPLIAVPDVALQEPSIAATPREKNSMLLMWILLGVSALILIIQIWTYLS